MSATGSITASADIEAQGISVPRKPSDYERGSRRSWIAVFGGLIGAFMAILDIQITNASMKEFKAVLGQRSKKAAGFQLRIWLLR